MNDRPPRRILISQLPKPAKPDTSSQPHNHPVIDPEISLDGIMLRQLKTLFAVVQRITTDSANPLNKDDISSLAQCVKSALDWKKSNLFINAESQEYKILEDIISLSFTAIDRISRNFQGIADCMDKDQINALNQLGRLILDFKLKQKALLQALDEDALKELAGEEDDSFE